MRYDTSRVDSFKDLANGLDIKSFLGAFTALLTDIQSSNKCTDKADPKMYWHSPYYTFIYCVKVSVATYTLRTTSDPEYQDQKMLDEMADSLDIGPYVVIANWLDWNKEYNLYEKYSTKIDLSHQQGWVFKAYYPVMAAAASMSDAYFNNAARMVPCYKRLEFAEHAENLTKKHYAGVFDEKSIADGINNARSYIDAQCENKFFVD
jgi:hypothetical protein